MKLFNQIQNTAHMELDFHPPKKPLILVNREQKPRKPTGFLQVF